MIKTKKKTIICSGLTKQIQEGHVESLSNFVHFVKLHLNDYGVFRGANEFDFNRHRTIIVGTGGTGKSTIANALASLGPVKGTKPNSQLKSSEMAATVITEGNRNLIKEYNRLIFFDDEFLELLTFDQEAPFLDMLSHRELETVKDEACALFHEMLSRKRNTHEDINPDIMSGDERICLGYAYWFAVRKELNLDLPAVFDAPYARFDSNFRHGINTFLRKQSCQQIILGRESEFNEEAKFDYTLDYPGLNNYH